MTFAYDPNKFFNPKITKVSVSIDGNYGNLYMPDGFKPYDHYSEARKYFITDELAKEFHLTDMTVQKYLSDHYGLWIELRVTDDNTMHGTGRQLK